MANENEAIQLHDKAPGSTRNVSVDLRGKLDTGELLTGTPVVTAWPSGLTLANKAVNSETLTIDGATCVAGQAVQFSVAGGSAGTDYLIVVACGTTSTPAQLAVELRCTLRVR